LDGPSSQRVSPGKTGARLFNSRKRCEELAVDVKEVNGGAKVSSFILAVDRNAEEADFALLHY
jgi:hypothetical protein